MIRISSPASVGIIAALFTACSNMADSTQEHQRNEPEAADLQEYMADSDELHRADAVIPPQEYYEALLEKQLSDPDSLSLADDPQVLWLNFNGASLTKGYAAGQSFILCNSSATIPASGISAADQTAIVDAAKSYFTKISARIRIVLDKPKSGDFTTMHVGGAYTNLGCSGSGVLGIAPLDKNNRNRNDVAFTFLIGGSKVKVVSDTIAHEAAHSFGLEHTTKKEDIMYPQAQNTSQFFTASPLANGQTQDGPVILKSVLGFECPIAPELPEPVSII